MTLGESLTTIRALLGTRDTANIWTDAVLTTLINLAQNQIWRRVVGYNPDLCGSAKRCTYAKDLLSLDLESAGALNSDIDAVLSVYAMVQDADPSTSNPAYVLRPIGLADIDSTRYGGNPSVTALADYTLQSAQFRYAMSGRTINIRPIPSIDQYLWVRYIATPSKLTAAADEIFGGDLKSLHDVVLYRTLMLAAARSKEGADHYMELERTAWEDSLTILESQSQEPLGVRNVSPG